jgi:conjugative transfer signal peptidase TraF
MKRLASAGLMAWAAMLAALLVLGQAGLRLNLSPSVPRGFYWLASKAPTRGAYVALCPPPSRLFAVARERGYLQKGRCAGDYAEMVKVLAAGPGDRASIGPDGVRVRGRLWPSSAPLSADARGRTLPKPALLPRELASDSVLVMSKDCLEGFDSRYFGALPRSAIVATAIPLATW